MGPIGSRQRSDCHTRALEIAHRAGDYSNFLRDLIEHAAAQTLPDGEHTGARPLALLDTDAYREWTVGLFKAWAEVGDILSFYQERIANEGFLATAREDRSVREIVRLIDYLPSPGVGSSTWLAYKLRELAGTPEIVVIPRRASVTSVPERKELPQTWETIAELRACVEWNAMRPRIPTVELDSSLPADAIEIQLEGAALGLDKGSPLLIEMDADEHVEPVFRRVVKVEETGGGTPATPDLTRVTLDRPLADAAPGEGRRQVVRLNRVFTFEQEVDLFGRDAPEWSGLEDKVKARYAQPLGGVVAGEPGAAWKSINGGLPEGRVLSVLAGPDGSLYAGTSDGVFRSVDGQNWRRAGADLIGSEILCLATDGRQQIFAGTAKNGVLRSTDGESWEVLLGEAIREPLITLRRGRLPRSGRLPLSPVRAVVPAEDRVFAGTAHGVFVFLQEADAWLAVNKGFPEWAPKTGRAGVAVQALIPGGGPGELFAGTDKGVFHTKNNGRSWEPRNTGLPGHDAKSGKAKISVLSLHFNDDRRTRVSVLMAGSDQGVFRSLDGGLSWEPASMGLPDADLDTGLCKTPVPALVFAADPQTLESCYFAATPEGVFISTDVGVYWAQAPDEEVRRPVSALAPSASGGLIASVPLGGFECDNWPGFRIRDGQLDLVTTALGIGEGDWLVVTDIRRGADSPGGEIARIVRAARVRQLARRDFTLEAVVTRVIPDRPLDGEEKFDLRTAMVLARTRPIRLPAGRRPLVQPLPAEVIRLDATQPLRPFPGARQVIIDGKPLRVRFAGPKMLRTDEGRLPMIGDGDEPQVLRMSRGGGGQVHLRLRIRGEVEGELTVPEHELTWLPAGGDAAAVAESVTAEWTDSALGGGGPALSLHQELENCYDPATVRIIANVVEASQGRTIYRDVIGSGDATKAHQRFSLSASPLAYVKTASAKGWASTLEIFVNGVRWSEVESLYDAKPDDRVYVVRHDIEGAATVIFGDGVGGARLPTGQDNVVALYRSGFWPDGVNRGRLTVPETKPLGLDGVTNPLRAAPGALPDDPDRARSRAPVALRTLDRIVSLQDYEDFCRGYPGVARARVASLATGGGAVVHVTAVTDDGNSMRPGGEFHRALMASIHAARSGRTPLVIDSYRPVFFDLRAQVRFDTERRAGDVERAVRDSVFAAYGLDRACFEGRVTASDIVRRIRSVPGVVSVKLERFHLSAGGPETKPHLQANPARWDAGAGKIIAAELLALRQPGGLVLKMEVAR